MAAAVIRHAETLTRARDLTSRPSDGGRMNLDRPRFARSLTAVVSRLPGRKVVAGAVLVAAAATIAIAGGAFRASAPTAQTDARPNIIVILVDDMGWSDIGPYGGEIPTPNLDALAARGVRFTQFYSTPRCSPTRASLLTGLYPHQAGMGHLDNVIREGSLGTTGRLNDRSVTIAEVLHDAGYFTAMSGKWHLGQQNGSPPWQRGFDRVLSLRAGGMYFPNQNFQGGGDELTRRAQEPLYLDGTPTPRDAPVFGQNWYATSLWTDFGLKFIDEARKANKPFFLYLAHNAPHFPLMAPPELIAKHRGKYTAGWDRLRDARYRRQITMGLIDAAWPLSPREPDSPAWESLSDEAKDRFDHLMAVYAAMVEAIDTSVGVLVKGLETRGALDNTLILFLSDDGANAESGPDGRFNGSPPSLRRTQPLFWEHEGNRAVRSGNWKLVSTYPMTGSCTTWRPTESSATTWRRGIAIL
jgi:arylsulfatase A-like enzyme